MNHALAMPRLGFKFVLTIREGPDVGASFQLLPPRVTIGRGADCNVILSDPRVSRTAAAIDFSMEKIRISDLSQRQLLMINGDFVQEADLKDGDVIRLGESEMTFFVETLPINQSFNSTNGGRSLGPLGIAPRSAAPPRGFAPQGMSKKQKFYVGLVIGLIAFAFLMMMDNAIHKKDPGLKTLEEMEAEVKASEKRQDELIEARKFNSNEEKTRYVEANRHFTEGFRDYQKGQWERAMHSFETARTIDPKHQLAERYFKLAEKQRDQMIADLTLEGRRYREKGMYARCSAQFEKVLEMIPNREDVKFKSAAAYKKECDLLMDDRLKY